MTFPEAVPLEKTMIGFVDTVDDVFEFKRWLGQKRDVLALDTETSGLSPYSRNARIRLFQCGDVNECYVIDAQKWPGLLYEVIENYQGQMVWHNIAFDAGFIRVMYPDLKFSWSRQHDTMLMARLYDNEAPAGLKPLSEKLWGKKATIGQDMLKATMENTKSDWNTVPLEAPAYRVYSGVDVILTARLYRHLHEVHSGKFRRAYQLEMETRRIANQMEYKGMRVDLDFVEEKSKALDEYVDRAIEYAKDKWGVKLGSTLDLGRWFVDNGADIHEYTATGAPKMDEDSLTHLINQGFDLADLALKARKATKTNSTYLKNFHDMAVDGVLHPQINTIQARTSRMSITNPALQTLNRDSDVVRNSMIPHSPDEMLVSCDCDQIEFRYISHLAGDEALRELFASSDAPGGLDVFTQIGREVFDDPTMVKKDPRRAICKTLVYARNYGAGVAKQALSAGIPKAHMQEISDSFDARYPGMNKFNSELVGRMNEMIRAGERPYVETFTGRRLYIPADKAYVAGNYLVQGSCAEVLKYNLVDLSMSGLDDYMCLPVHDECIFSIPRSELDEVVPVINECMTTTEFSIPLPASCDEPMTRWTKQ